MTPYTWSPELGAGVPDRSTNVFVRAVVVEAHDTVRREQRREVARVADDCVVGVPTVDEHEVDRTPVPLLRGIVGRHDAFLEQAADACAFRVDAEQLQRRNRVDTDVLEVLTIAGVRVDREQCRVVAESLQREPDQTGAPPEVRPDLDDGPRPEVGDHAPERRGRHFVEPAGDTLRHAPSVAEAGRLADRRISREHAQRARCRFSHRFEHRHHVPLRPTTSLRAAPQRARLSATRSQRAERRTRNSVKCTLPP